VDSTAFIIGKRLYLRKVRFSDVGEDYLSWLNDPETLRYSARKAFPEDEEGLRRYIEQARAVGDLHLAICEKKTERHIGCISLQSINWVHRSASLSILLGAKDVWGKGYAKETIALVMAHAFRSMGLHRLYAESPNPAFNSAVKKLGWVHEGTRRKSLLVDGAFVDMALWGLLATEFVEYKP
jgi:ribosomal-protein-alanine N-acetyltransferase